MRKLVKNYMKYSLVRGFTEKSVRRYCKVHGIKKMDEQEIDDIVSKAVVEVSTHDAIFILVFIHLQHQFINMVCGNKFVLTMRINYL